MQHKAVMAMNTSEKTTKTRSLDQALHQKYLHKTSDLFISPQTLPFVEEGAKPLGAALIERIDEHRN